MAFRYVLTSSVNITLVVKPSNGPRSVVAGVHGNAGFNQIKWNRRLRGKRAAHGRYKLIATATVGGSSVTSTLNVKL